MPGGLMQLVGKGAQDVLVTGNPSFTHFRSVYKRHSEFAMEHFRLYFKTSNLNLPQSGSLTLRTKVERYAQLLHDCYVSITLPDIYSPVVALNLPHPNTPNFNPSSTAIGFEFQWIHSIGYNMINYVSVLINGQEIVRHTGEWLKLYAATKMDATKKAILNDMIGNVEDMYDPANSFNRINQYPHSITTSTNTGAPSIAGRVLTIPLHFWFCESIGSALPLIALQHSEVEFVIDLKNIYQLFTVRDVRETVAGVTNTNFGMRGVCPSDVYTISQFLSPPLLLNQAPSNPTLTTWKMNPFVECNFIFVSDAEMSHIATTDHSFMLTQIDTREANGQYGPSNDLDLIMRNLCTRVVWVCQRTDRALKNDFDNYTNWTNPYEPPLKVLSTGDYSSGSQQPINISMRDILLESSLIIDGKERFGFKQTEFFSNIQNYRHHTGLSTKDIPGIYTYSFALEHNITQPTGHINGSQFNKTILRNTYVQPPLASVYGVVSAPSETCVIKATANSPNPTQVNSQTFKGSANELVRIIQKTEASTLVYSYNVRAYVESYNFLRVMGGIANVVFSS